MNEAKDIKWPMTPGTSARGEEGAVALSVVIPVYNEEENLPELFGRLRAVMEGLGAFEVVMADDGSTDGSWRVIKELHAKDSRFRGLRLSRNFGHHIALSAGLDHARGEAVVLMDADLQDLPEEIPRLLEKFREGFDIVYGIRRSRQDPPLKKLSSALFWFLLRRFTGVSIPPGQTMLRVLSRRAVDALRSMREYARFLHGMMAWTGFDATTLEVSHGARLKGKSKYDLPKLFRLAFNAITSFSIVPLRIAVYTGLLSSALSLAVGLYYIWRKLFFGIPVLGYASTITAVFFVGGVQLLMLGLFGEYLGRVYQEVQGRPLYFVKEVL